MMVESAVTGDRLSRIRELAVDLLGNLGYELNDLEFSSGEGGSVLRLYIDCAAGVTLDDCAHVSRMFGALLDVEDLIPGRYNLEISSPGLNRRLSRIQDFQGCYGETIKIRLARPLDGRRRFKGILRTCQENPLTVTLEVDGQTFVVPLDETAKCNLVYDFDKIF
ncbi:MAG TPA: ribosome maturation factor RimP [Proteobacteria bacterium]|nr:ribosome maturation factor RimP [Pseudomonadota bacterium]